MANKRTSALTDIGEALVDADEIPIANASDTAETRKSAMSRVWTYIDSKLSYKPSGTDVAVADGGTGASDATTARTNLGVVNNATHTGEVTGSGALTVDKTAITGKTLVTPVAGADHVLIADASDSDNLKKAVWPTSGGSSGPADHTNGMTMSTVERASRDLVCRSLIAQGTSSNGISAPHGRFVQFEIPADGEISAVKWEVKTSNSGNCRVGVYSADSVGDPDTILHDSGDVSNGSTGTKTSTFSSPIAVSAGDLIWAFIRPDETTVIECYTSSSSVYPITGTQYTGGGGGIEVANQTPTIPLVSDPWGDVTVAATTARTPHIRLTFDAA